MKLFIGADLSYMITFACNQEYKVHTIKYKLSLDYLMTEIIIIFHLFQRDAQVYRHSIIRGGLENRQGGPPHSLHTRGNNAY